MCNLLISVPDILCCKQGSCVHCTQSPDLEQRPGGHLIREIPSIANIVSNLYLYLTFPSFQGYFLNICISTLKNTLHSQKFTTTSKHDLWTRYSLFSIISDLVSGISLHLSNSPAFHPLVTPGWIAGATHLSLSVLTFTMNCRHIPPELGRAVLVPGRGLRLSQLTPAQAA